MALDDKQLQQILDMFQKSGWNEMHLESGTVKLSISKTGRPTPPARAAAPATAPAQPQATPAQAAAATPSSAPAASKQPSAADAKAAAPDPNWVAVKAPLLGNFYAAPKPGAPPFVEVGQQVKPGDTLAILEVMKLMNHVKSEVGGKVARVVAENGNLVEFDEVLFYIDPT